MTSAGTIRAVPDTVTKVPGLALVLIVLKIPCAEKNSKICVESPVEWDQKRRKPKKRKPKRLGGYTHADYESLKFTPVFRPKYFSPRAQDFFQYILKKQPEERLGKQID